MSGKVYWGLYSLRGSDDTAKGPTMILVGDSWFWYPFNNLATEIASKLREDHVLLVLGDNGAEARQFETDYRKNINQAFEWYAGSCKALLISAGGNDIAGSRDFDPIIEDDCSKAKTVADCYSPGQPDAIISAIQNAYRLLISRFRKYNPDAPVVFHNYEKAWPTGRGVFGPADWLQKPMEDAQVPKPLRHALFVDLIERLHAAQVELKQSDATPDKIIVIESAGTLPDTEDIWANELHLKPTAYKKMVKLAWKPVLKAIDIA